MNKMHQQIKAIFEEIKEKWDSVNKDPKAFPKICYDALARDVEYSAEAVKEIIQKDLPKQSYPGDEFGEVPVTVFSNDDFFIDIYNWNSHHTSIHDHNFIGAFKLIHGRSHQFCYDFNIEEEISPKIKRGKLVKKSSHVVKVGDRQTILDFKDFIHEVLHFDNPTVTLLVRNYWYEENLNTYTKEFMVKPKMFDTSLRNKANAICYFYNINSPKQKEALLKSLKENDDQFIVTAITKTGTLFNKLQSNDSRKRLRDDLMDICKNSAELPNWVSSFLENYENENKRIATLNKFKLI